MKSLIELLFKGFRKKRNIIKESSFLEIIDKWTKYTFLLGWEYRLIAHLQSSWDENIKEIDVEIVSKLEMYNTFSVSLKYQLLVFVQYLKMGHLNIDE